MTKLNNDINDFEISDGKNHVLYFTDDKLKLRTIDIDVQPIIDAIETTIYNMLDAKQLKYNGLKNGLDDWPKSYPAIEKSLYISSGLWFLIAPEDNSMPLQTMSYW